MLSVSKILSPHLLKMYILKLSRSIPVPLGKKVSFIPSPFGVNELGANRLKSPFITMSLDAVSEHPKLFVVVSTTVYTPGAF